MPETQQKGKPRCWEGPVSYTAPGYLEGASINFSFIIGATFATEIVYDFATMEKQKFTSKQIGISIGIGVSGIEYQGVIFNFTNTKTLVGEYPGSFVYGSVGAGTGFPGVVQLGTGVTGFKSLSNEVWGVSQYYSIGWSPIPSPISMSAEVGYGFASPGEMFNPYIMPSSKKVNVSQLISDITIGKNSPAVIPMPSVLVRGLGIEFAYYYSWIHDELYVNSK
jgi:hypothetical protein